MAGALSPDKGLGHGPSTNVAFGLPAGEWIDCGRHRSPTLGRRRARPPNWSHFGAFRRAAAVPRYAAYLLAAALGAPAFAQPTFTLQPIASTGLSHITDTEIVIPMGGVEVTFEVLAYGWSSAPGNPRLGAFQATIDEMGFLGANAVPPNPGVNLDWAGGSPFHSACFQALKTCNVSGLDCTVNASVCAGIGNFCLDNPRFVGSVCNVLCATCPIVLECALGWASMHPACWATDPGPDGAQNAGYCGTVILQVPPEAVGTYTIGFVNDVNKTFMNDSDAGWIPGLRLVPARVTILDCNGNGIADGAEGGRRRVADCNGNGVLDECDIADGTSADCNRNRTPDECDVSDDASRDCNANGVPDECEPDCNGNRIADVCDLASGTSRDCNTDATPDECNIASGAADDCDGNGVPDECQPDSDADGAIDACDGCPADALKTVPGPCGCGVSDADGDADTVADCHDLCPGGDDTIDLNENGAPDCSEYVPAVSTWGLLITALALLVAAKVRFGMTA